MIDIGVSVTMLLVIDDAPVPAACSSNSAPIVKADGPSSPRAPPPPESMSHGRYSTYVGMYLDLEFRNNDQPQRSIM